MHAATKCVPHEHEPSYQFVRFGRTRVKRDLLGKSPDHAGVTLWLLTSQPQRKLVYALVHFNYQLSWRAFQHVPHARYFRELDESLFLAARLLQCLAECSLATFGSIFGKEN